MRASPVGDVPIRIDAKALIRQESKKALVGSPGITLPCWEEQMEVQVSSQDGMSLLVYSETASAREMNKCIPPSSSTLNWSWTTADFILFFSLQKYFLPSSSIGPLRVLIPGYWLLKAGPIWKDLVASWSRTALRPSWNCEIFHSAGKPFFLPSSNKGQFNEK